MKELYYLSHLSGPLLTFGIFFGFPSPTGVSSWGSDCSPGLAGSGSSPMPPRVALALGICYIVPCVPGCSLPASLCLVICSFPLVSDALFLSLMILVQHLKPFECLLRTFQIHTAIVSPLSSLGPLDWLGLISHPPSHRDAVILGLGAIFLYPGRASNDTGTRTELLFLLPPQSNSSHLTEVSPCSYLDASAFRDHDLPHAVETVEVRLREAGGEDGSPALSEVATTRHWEDTWVGQRLLGSSLWWLHESFSMHLPWGLEPCGSAEPPPGLASPTVSSSTSLRISGLCWVTSKC